MPSSLPSTPDKPNEFRFPALDAWLSITLFWLLALVVFVQFFTRYVLNDSLGWTEEIARYLLIGVTFAGACIAVRRNTHISVEFFYRYIPEWMARRLSVFVGILRTILFAALTTVCFQLAGSTRQLMTSIDLPKSIIYGFVGGCFALMTIYSLIVAWRHFRSGKADVAPDVPAEIIE